MKRSAYVLAFVAIGAAIAATAVSTHPQRPEMLAQAASAPPALAAISSFVR
jgi:hypothetical protein